MFVHLQQLMEMFQIMMETILNNNIPISELKTKKTIQLNLHHV